MESATTTTSLLPFLLLTLLLHHGARGQSCQVNDGLEQAFTEACMQESSLNTSICGQAWLAFSGAFSSVSPSQVTIDDFDEYFNVIPIGVVPDSVLFWSGTETLVRFIAQRPNNGICSSYTEPSAKIIGTLDAGVSSWCSNLDSNQFSDIRTMFWAAFSTKLGRAAEGIVFWCTTTKTRNGRTFTYSMDSFFGQHELPVLEAPRVKRMVVINVNLEGTGESCAGGVNSTLQVLQDIVEGKMLSYYCVDVNGDPSSPDMTMQEALADRVYWIIDEERSPSSAAIVSFSLPLMMLITAIALTLAY